MAAAVAGDVNSNLLNESKLILTELTSALNKCERILTTLDHFCVECDSLLNLLKRKNTKYNQEATDDIKFKDGDVSIIAKNDMTMIKDALKRAELIRMKSKDAKSKTVFDEQKVLTAEKRIKNPSLNHGKYRQTKLCQKLVDKARIAEFPSGDGILKVEAANIQKSPKNYFKKNAVFSDLPEQVKQAINHFETIYNKTLKMRKLNCLEGRVKFIEKLHQLHENSDVETDVIKNRINCRPLHPRCFVSYPHIDEHHHQVHDIVNNFDGDVVIVKEITSSLHRIEKLEMKIYIQKMFSSKLLPLVLSIDNPQEYVEFSRLVYGVLCFEGRQYPSLMEIKNLKID